MSAVFAETELRRYPLTAADRRIARHLTGILDPFWFLFLALELGLAVGLYVMGAGSFWFGLIAVLLLFAANYLLARVVGLFIDQLMQRKGGAPVLMMLIMTLAILPSLDELRGKIIGLINAPATKPGRRCDISFCSTAR